jgi:hypothetical protein
MIGTQRANAHSIALITRVVALVEGLGRNSSLMTRLDMSPHACTPVPGVNKLANLRVQRILNFLPYIGVVHCVGKF